MVESNVRPLDDVRAPRVSVVVACFNCERYIDRAIESVLAQTLTDLEIVVVDDASSDASCERVLAHADKRVRLLRNAVNAGPSQTRNTGFAATRGDWIAILDGDDWMAPDRLERLIEFGEAHNADAVADDLNIIFDGEDRARSTWFAKYGVVLPEDSMLEPVDILKHDIGVMKAVFRRDLFEGQGHRYDESVKYGEDFLLYLSWLLAGAKFAVHPRAMYYLRRGNTGSLTTNHIVLVEQVLKLNLDVARRAEVRSQRALADALQKRIEGLRTLLRYHLFMFPIRSGRYLEALAALWSDPGVLFEVARHVLGVCRRLRRDHALW